MATLRLLFLAVLCLPYPSFSDSKGESRTNPGGDEMTKLESPAATNDQDTDRQQQQEERPKEDPTQIEVGPYDRNGNFNFINKKPDEGPTG